MKFLTNIEFKKTNLNIKLNKHICGVGQEMSEYFGILKLLDTVYKIEDRKLHFLTSPGGHLKFTTTNFKSGSFLPARFRQKTNNMKVNKLFSNWSRNA